MSVKYGLLMHARVAVSTPDYPFSDSFLTEFYEVHEERFIVAVRVRAGRGTTKLPLFTFPTPPLELMHPIAWNRDSAKFAKMFSYLAHLCGMRPRRRPAAARPLESLTCLARVYNTDDSHS